MTHPLASSPRHAWGVLFVSGTVFVIWRAHRAIECGAQEALALALAAATVSLLGFGVLTRMHERYMFTALVLFAPLAFVRPLRAVYVSLSALFVLNLWYVYGSSAPEWQKDGWSGVDFRFDPLFDWMFGRDAIDTPQQKLWSFLVTVVAALVVSFGPRWVRLAPGSTSADRPV